MTDYPTTKKIQLLEAAKKARRGVADIESILNDGIEHDPDFLNELHEEIRSQIKTLVRIKGILCKRYGIVAV